MIHSYHGLNSFSELMPIVLNIVIGLPQILSNIQYVFPLFPHFNNTN